MKLYQGHLFLALELFMVLQVKRGYTNEHWAVLCSVSLICPKPRIIMKVQQTDWVWTITSPAEECTVNQSFKQKSCDERLMKRKHSQSVQSDGKTGGLLPACQKLQARSRPFFCSLHYWAHSYSFQNILSAYLNPFLILFGTYFSQISQI